MCFDVDFGLPYQPLDAVFARFRNLYLLQHMDGFAAEVWTVNVCLVEDVAALAPMGTVPDAVE